MPEMPDVEALARFLAATVGGGRVAGLQLGSFTALKTVDPPVSAVRGARVDGVERRGKILLIRMTGAESLTLAVHLYRAGWVAWRAAPPVKTLAPGKGPIVARLATDGGAADFTEAGTQRRLALWLVRDVGEVEPIARYGPEALELAADPAGWRAALAAQPARLKTWLTDQQVLAGIGNGFSDDILQAARLSPFAQSDRLDDDEAERLRGATATVLTGAVEALSGLAPARMKDAKKARYTVHGRAGEPCPQCGATIRSVHYATTSFQYCPGCQTKGKVLADRTTSRFLK